ncbi:MAG: EAL domain-containing protein [Halofilum sp. (in: g-proteobacteria)]|nr:EAL domain-containing protein [Halofilum sp. (in: g-proteobacteria)]
MNSNSTIRLLVVSEAPESAERVASLMRTAGYAVKPTTVADPDALGKALANGSVDVALHVLDTNDVELGDTLGAIRERGLFVPVLACGEGEPAPGPALAQGAADRIQDDDDEHLRHAIVREFERVLTRRRAHYLDEAYRESEQRARALMESSRDAIAYIHDGMHVLANDAYLSRFGYEGFEELEGTPMVDMVASNNRDKLKEFLRNFSASEEAVGKLDLSLQQADGSTFDAEIEFSRASIEGEACSQIIIRDQGNTEELEKQLELLSQRDSVTGLYNRQHFMKLLQRALAAAERDEGSSALLQLNLDDFHQVKESVGVIGGDQVITDVARVLQKVCGEHDAIARLDGATYAVLTPVTDTQELEQLATRIRGAIKDHVCDVDGTSISVTATLGIARIDGSTADPNDILSRAERALSDAMNKGPDAHRIYEPRAGELSQKQIDQQWVERIKEVLKNDQLALLYQPIVSLADDTTARYEVQPRVLDDGGHAVEDEELMAAAARTGMSKGLDRWVVLNALKALVEQLKHDRETIFFVPLSGHAFDDPGLFRWIHERVRNLKLPEGRLVFQVDAGAAATRIKQAGAFATAAHKIGCAMALSGFGNGAEPFQVTRHVAVDYLRINEEFMRNLAENAQNQDAIKQITAQARELGKLTICPGVADAGTLTVLWGLGSDMIEGEFLQEASRERNYDFSSMAM